MKYLEWNNIISAYFFNPFNTGKDIHLYLTKNDIINIARQHFNEETDDEIWTDFIASIKRGIPGSNGNVVAKAKYAHSKSNVVGIKKTEGTFATIDDVPVLYPPYISYLVFLVLPLIVGIDDKNLKANAYSGRLNSLLANNQINETIGTTDFRNNQINCLREDLANWAHPVKLSKESDLALLTFSDNPHEPKNPKHP
ncbi:hypothetical protein [Flagellimonas abyssi]|uniref:Uncharacterized protein n=1 Tax=Flagellimonas abyssi TaxID=2864871 RepID=A0ABS7ETG3_9FLAO|nr:hypothetical protein [Allomuricauda abyssi]MBW8200901.1 hypothetical protein [Allomuricauda abyssi]